MMSMRMLSHRSEQEIYQALEECDMDFIDAMLRLSKLERKKNGEAGGGGEREGRGTNGAEGASRACPDCPMQSKKQ
ncbi:uncharacterized protein J3R85_005294 [Psidium guajava]|nr:uncharacterized protein J3R85_005294 [Psidium guajava]